VSPTRQRRLEAPDSETAGPTECRVEIAAILEGTTHISGIGWRVTSPDGTETLRTETRRYGRTLIYSELAALRGALDAARRHGCRVLALRVPDPRTVALLRGDRRPRYRRAEAAAAELRPLLGEFTSVRYDSGHPPDPELWHAVGEALDAGLHAAAEREEHRQHLIERMVERAKLVQLEQRPDGEWIANGRYRVRLDPMRCECPAWLARWARAPIAGRRAQRLPCKHLVALALREGIRTPSDLAEMARRASP
jgi:hypothetical protein